ncbi:hypothetical protein Ciccas_011696, partial [Cichlidogyrus casuarinus]
EHKRGLVRCLFSRLRDIVSDELIEEESRRLTEILLGNGYPLGFIQRNGQATVQDKTTTNEAPTWISLPFKGDAAAVTARAKLSNLMERTFGKRHLRFNFRTTKLFSLGTKDRLRRGMVSGVVYQFTCPCGSNYVGQNVRRLEDRAGEHLGKAKTAVSEHLEVCAEVASESNFEVLYKAHGDNFKTKVDLARAEALLIQRHGPTLCKQRENKIKLALPWTAIGPQRKAMTRKPANSTNPDAQMNPPEETQPVPEMEATPAFGTKRARDTETKPKPKRKREGLAPDPKQRLMSEFLTQPKGANG